MAKMPVFSEEERERIKRALETQRAVLKRSLGKEVQMGPIWNFRKNEIAALDELLARVS